jgi:hypothetical protein
MQWRFCDDYRFVPWREMASAAKRIDKGLILKAIGEQAG